MTDEQFNAIMTVLGQHTEEFKSIKNRLTGVEGRLDTLEKGQEQLQQNQEQLQQNQEQIKATLKEHSDLFEVVANLQRGNREKIEDNTKRIEAVETMLKN